MITVTDIAYRGNGYTATFSDKSVADVLYKVTNGTLTLLGLNTAQTAAIAVFNSTVEIDDPRFSGPVLQTQVDDLQTQVDNPDVPDEIQVSVRSRGDFSKETGPLLTPLFPWTQTPVLVATVAIGGVGSGCAWSPGGEFLAITTYTTPYIKILQRVGVELVDVSSNLAPLASWCWKPSWSPDGRFLSCSTNAADNLYLFRRAGNVFTALATPTPTSGPNVAFSPNGRYLATWQTLTPFMQIFEMNGIYESDGATTTVLATVGVLPAGTDPTSSREELAWTHDGQYLAAGSKIKDLRIYKNDESLSPPFALLPALPGTAGITDQSYAVRWSPDGKVLLIGTDVAPFFMGWTRVGDTFTEIPAANLPQNHVPFNNTINKIEFSPDGRYLAVSTYNSLPTVLGLYIFESDMATVPTYTLFGDGYDMDPAGFGASDAVWSPDQQFIAAVEDSVNNVRVWQTDKDMPTSGNLIVSGIPRAGT